MKTKWVTTQNTRKFLVVPRYMMNWGSLILISVLVLVISCDKNEELDNLDKYEVNFANTPGLLREGDDGQQIIIKLNKPAKEDLIILIKTNGTNQLNFEGVNLASNDNIAVTFTKGLQQVVFEINKPNDNIINEQLQLELVLRFTDAKFKMGKNNILIIEIVDDELSGFPKSQILSHLGVNQSTKTFFYRFDGLINKVETKIKTGEVFRDTYEYGENGEIIKTSTTTSSNNYSSQQTEINFIWENNKIIKSQIYDIESSYQYNSKDQIISKIDSYLGYNFVSTFNYTYFDDGNIFRIEESYTTDTWWGEPIPETNYKTVTEFMGYKDKVNIFPDFAIIPTKIIQNYLPSSTKITYYTNGVFISSDFTEYQYQFDNYNRVTSKSFNDTKYDYTYYE